MLSSMQSEEAYWNLKPDEPSAADRQPIMTPFLTGLARAMPVRQLGNDGRIFMTSS